MCLPGSIQIPSISSPWISWNPARGRSSRDQETNQIHGCSIQFRTQPSVRFRVSCLRRQRRSAQGLGSISGTVVDGTGAVVPAASVALTQTRTGEIIHRVYPVGRHLCFPSVSPAQYKLDVSAKGFKRYQQVGISLLADQSLSLNVALPIGSADVTVNVEADAAQVNVTTGTLSQVIGQQQVNDLPLNGRNAAALTKLVAGVTLAPRPRPTREIPRHFPSSSRFRPTARLVGQTNYMLDGGNNVDEYTNVNEPFPMPDAVQEFSVETNNYNAQYGQNAGGVVNIITKSGTSQYHGDLFEYVRNRAFNAANYFSYVNGVKTVDPLKRNQFGGTIGGPLQIPHIFHGKDPSSSSAIKRPSITRSPPAPSPRPCPPPPNSRARSLTRKPVSQIR